jgi:mannose-6-phosphate isomerase class I
MKNDRGKLIDAMVDEAYQRRDELDPLDDFEWLFEKHFEAQQLKLHYQKTLESKSIQQTLDGIQEMLREYHTDKRLFEENPMKYYGLKQGDFI